MKIVGTGKRKRVSIGLAVAALAVCMLAVPAMAAEEEDVPAERAWDIFSLQEESRAIQFLEIDKEVIKTDPSKLTLQVIGQTETVTLDGLTAEDLEDGQSLTWESTNDAVVTVKESADDPTTATVTLKASGSGTVKINVYLTEEETDEKDEADAEEAEPLATCEVTVSLYSDGFHREPNGSDWYYYKSGKVDTGTTGVITGTVDGKKGDWYVVKGKVNRTATVVKYNGTWWYFNANGMRDTSYTGFAENGNGKWYCEKGKVTFNKQGILKDSNGGIGSKGDWYYVIGSKVQTSFTGLSNFSNENGWWYIKKGKVDFSANTVAKNKNGWWYVEGGKVIFSYNGFGENGNGKWYCEGGKVKFDKNDVIKDTTGALGSKGAWYYVVGSKVQTSYTGVADYKNKNGWWYVKNGKVDFSANTVAKNKNGWWYVEGGKVIFSYNGFGENKNGKWYCEGGKVKFDKNDVIKDTTGALGSKGAWYYVVDSKVDTSFTGLGSNSNGTWYIENGKVNFNYSGKYNGYTIENGKLIRVYQNPSQYYQIQSTQITLDGGGYNLDTGYEGLKTAWVMKALGLGNYAGNHNCIYTSSVKSAVKSFQKKKGLTATGITNLATWKAMGYTEEEWYSLGAYVSPLQTDANSTRSDCIEAMISRAYDYLGTSFVIGASGAPGTGVDCSGLVMQALYAAGIDMSPINPVRHALPGYEYESRNIWASSKMKHVSYSSRERGDLIFYSNSGSSTVVHVAIYLGNNQIIDAWPSKVRVHSVNISGYSIVGVARPFA